MGARTLRRLVLLLFRPRRLLLGERLCDALHLPRGSLWDRLLVKATVWSMRLLGAVGTLPFLDGWWVERNRRACLRLIGLVLGSPATYQPNARPLAVA